MIATGVVLPDILLPDAVFPDAVCTIIDVFVVFHVLYALLLLLFDILVVYGCIMFL
jgi:hypothetical protein